MSMDVQVRAPGLKADEEAIRAEITAALDRFAERLTRVEVHLRDENGAKGGIDKRCLLEARPRGLDPLTAEHHAATLGEAIAEATGKLERVLDHRFGRLEGRH